MGTRVFKKDLNKIDGLALNVPVEYSSVDAHNKSHFTVLKC